MKRIRPRQERSPGFDALEGRLTMSTGLAVASPHAHALPMGHAPGSILATFKGHTTIDGPTEATLDLTGRIGRDRFNGNGSVAIAGTIVQGGDAELGNSQGTIQFSLGAASVTRAGKHPRQAVPIVVTGATGAYAPYVGSSGLLTTWKVPANPNAVSTFSGYLDPS